jgi:glycine/D-amino acid oxidase-like deaminating enzyme
MSPPVNPVISDDKLPARADVVVIGGGIIGCAAAYFLARRGISVALIEKGRIAGEQSSRNWGWCRQQGRDKAEIPLIKESLAIWGRLQEEIGADPGFRRQGILYLTRDPAELAGWERWLEHARRHQIGSRLLSAAEAQAMTPDCREKWIGGLHTPSDGRAEPALAAPAIAEAARRAGASLHQRCAARGLEREAGKVAMVVTEQGAIRTGAVLLAGGAWSSIFLRRHGLDLPQLTVRASVMRTEKAPAVTEGAMGTPGFSIRRRLDGGYSLAQNGVGFEITPDAFRYMRAFWPAFRQEHRHLKLRFGRAFFQALARPRDWALDRPSPFEAERILDPEPDHGLLNQALANLQAAFPALAGVRMAESWAGMIDATPDAVPVISPVDSLPGLHIATGFSGHGFGIGPGAGRLAADLVSGAPPVVDPYPFRYSRMIDGTPLVPDAGL